MTRAISLAHLAVGKTSPNPPVGAVVVKEGEIVGEGRTLPAGQSHAEIVALQQAGPKANEGILYVTLEPCCIYGRTPPCTDAIIEAGIKEVHIATIDPNGKVNGNGVSTLEAAGVNVCLGENADQVHSLYEAYSKHITSGLPFVIAKFAMTVDGKIATNIGDSKWITGNTARLYAHQIRTECDAIMVGINTVLSDDPQLTARDEKNKPLSRQPIRVIVDSQARTPMSARMLNEPGNTIIAVSNLSRKRVAAFDRAGLEVLPVPSPTSGKVNLTSLLEILGERGVVRLMVEGGGTLLGSLFDHQLVDKVLAFIAPRILGGTNAPSPVEGHGVSSITEAISLKCVTLQHLGEDFLVTGYTQGTQKLCSLES